MWLFLAVPWICLQFVVVVIPDNTHILFMTLNLDVAFLLSVSIFRIKT